MADKGVQNQRPYWSPRGEVGELIFRLSFAASEPPLAPNETHRTRIWIDDVRLGPAVAPLEVAAVSQATNGIQELTTGDFLPLIEASRMGWLGIVEMPDGRTGIESGDFGIPAHVFFATGSPAMEGNARTSEGSFDVQRLFADSHTSNTIFVTAHETTGNPGVGLLGAIEGTYQLGGIVIKRLPPTAIPLRPKRIPVCSRWSAPASRRLL
jgi:hypothetical protein